MNLPFFSLIVCNYNNGQFFNKCFESIKNQTYDNFEVIIIDDNSSDNSVEIISDLIKLDNRFKLYTNEENRGYSFSLDKGINLAMGEYIARLDPDDAIVENAIELSLQKLLNNISAIASYSKMMVCDKDLNSLYVNRTTQKIKNGNKLFFNIFFEITHFFVFRKDAYIKSGGLDITLSSSVDQDLYLKLYDIGEIIFINEPLYYYRIHEKGISQDLNKKKRLKLNRNSIILNTLKRRNIQNIYNTDISQIEDPVNFIFEKSNTILTRIRRKLLIFCKL